MCFLGSLSSPLFLQLSKLDACAPWSPVTIIIITLGDSYNLVIFGDTRTSFMMFRPDVEGPTSWHSMQDLLPIYSVEKDNILQLVHTGINCQSCTWITQYSVQAMLNTCRNDNNAGIGEVKLFPLWRLITWPMYIPIMDVMQMLILLQSNSFHCDVWSCGLRRQHGQEDFSFILGVSPFGTGASVDFCSPMPFDVWCWRNVKE